MHFVSVTKVADFPGNGPKVVRLRGKLVGVFRKEDGSFYAMEVQCKHQGGDLTRGKMEGTVAVCPRHGWRYDLVTGECVFGDSPPLRRHAVRIEGDEIQVSLGVLHDEDEF